MCLFNVDGGQRAVIFDRFQGVKEAVVGEGTHFMIPVVQKPIVIDVRARPRTINSITGTKDLQMANISLRVLSRPLEAELPRIYQELGTDFDDRVLPSLGNEVGVGCALGGVGGGDGKLVLVSHYSALNEASDPAFLGDVGKARRKRVGDSRFVVPSH